MTNDIFLDKKKKKKKLSIQDQHESSTRTQPEQSPNFYCGRHLLYFGVGSHQASVR